jgi:hypothetical protein
LNNCTDRAQPGHEDAAKPWPKKPTGAESWHVDQVFDLAPLPDELDDWWDSEEYRGYVVEVAEAVEHFGHWHDAAAAAKAATVWTETSYTEAEIKRVAMRARAIRAKAERARA